MTTRTLRSSRSRSQRRISVAAAATAATLLLAGWGGAGPALSAAKVASGGVASYALTIGESFSWMFPIENSANYEGWDSNVEDGMWRPLYFAGNGASPGIDYGTSLAAPPVYSDGDRAVTVTMKKGFTWSDGVPVTNTDVKFFFELLSAGKADDGAYIPGELPDNVTSISYSGAYQFTLHLNKAYNPAWFTGNQLTWIYPLPRQEWDRTCATCAVGHHASTPKGAKAVFTFIEDQSKDLTTYATNPLWKVVDGPWVIKSYQPTTGDAAFAANTKYTGPGKPHLAGYKIYSFTSDTAEVDAVRSGTVSFGFIPFSDIGQVSYFTRNGFTVAPWRVFYNETVELGYTSKLWGPLVDQLYIRQALQHLVNEKLFLSATLFGYGLADYGVAPDYPGSPYVSPELRTDPYPYDVNAAKALLASHGWAPGPSGVDVCKRPGTGLDDCGAGIAGGRQLSFSFMYSTGAPSFAAQVESFQATAKQAGIGITLNGQTETTMFSIGGVCPASPPCNYGLLAYSGFMWDFGQYEILPVGGNQFGKGNFFGGGYYSPTAQALIDNAHTKTGLAPLYADENYLSKDVASLWWPVSDYEIVVAQDNLRGWQALSPYANYHPSTWYFAK